MIGTMKNLRVITRSVRPARQMSTALRRSQDGTAAASFLAAAGVCCYLSMDKPKVTFNHCQVPCGIFDDPATVDQLEEACVTIRKAIVQSKILHGTANVGNTLSMNQMFRWIMTKEEHANKIINLVSEYMLCQRVKRQNFKTEKEYLQALKIHHVVMQAAMKTKQSMDEESCNQLDKAVADLAKMYRRQPRAATP
mmetsp:Transcript_27374/g.41434  ORF Transcript_27374/g.41434 Transcript_27374/m.41434 type:complete len:195 (+) Transcript_27374:73-657(+)